MDNFLKSVSDWLPKKKASSTSSLSEVESESSGDGGSHPHVKSTSPKHTTFVSRVTRFANGHRIGGGGGGLKTMAKTTPSASPRLPAPPRITVGDESDVPQPMDSEAFRKWGKTMVDFVADYWATIRDRRPLHNVEPGYIRSRVPTEAPEDPDNWETIFADLENVVMDGTTHWHHPHFFAYYPAANSYPAIMGDILSDGLGCIGFTWNSSPACTELEMVVMDWLGKMINLPEHFLNSDSGPGAGMIQSTASDSTLVALLAARNRRLFSMRAKLRSSFSNSHDTAAISTLVAYCSDQAHSSVERAALLAGVRMRKLHSSAQFELTGEILAAAMKEDMEQGLVPFFTCVTLGTTNSCSFDHLNEIGPMCQDMGVWVHVDAAYAGSSFVCPEYRKFMEGIVFADSFNFNPAKWLMVNMDCSAMWFKNAFEIEQAFLVDPLYLKHEHQGNVPDYKNLQIPLGRRFRSLKLWFVLRAIGIKGLQQHIRSMCVLAKEFETLVLSDERFEVVVPVRLGLVCFRAKGSNETNEQLLKEINKDRRIHLVPAQLRELYVLRLAICSSLTRSEDVAYAWQVIAEIYEKVINKSPAKLENGGHLHEG